MSKPARSISRDVRHAPDDAPAAFLPLLRALAAMDETGRRAFGPVVNELLAPVDPEARIVFLMSGELPEDSIRRALSAMNHDA